MKHTKAPWNARRKNSNQIIISGNTNSGEPIATITHPHFDSEAEANAEIITLAPEMFEALLKLARAKHVSTSEFRTCADGIEMTKLFVRIERMANQ